ncbi:ATP phosphoribosyltransferase [Clostridia bacterium]|nr:ATP phosphoribosyltransferase [Clostridia bacterium]
MSENYLTFALAKGRLADNAMKLLKDSGVSCPEMENKNSRKLIFTNEEYKYKFFLAKASDVPVYVERGAADVGFAGKDTLREEHKNICEVLDLGFGKCRIMVAGYDTPANRLKLAHGHNLRIATKYPNIATEYFENKNQSIEIIKLNGSVELAPIVGLSDFIVDIVETGTTLQENGLTILEEIGELSARMVVNTASIKIKNHQITNLIRNLEKTLSEGQ